MNRYTIGSRQALCIAFDVEPNEFGVFGPVQVWIGGHPIGRTGEQHFLDLILQMLNAALAIGLKTPDELHYVPSTEFMDGFVLDVGRQGEHLRFRWTDLEDQVFDVQVPLEDVRATVGEFHTLLSTLKSGSKRTKNDIL
jgi:hypothetical protein